MEYTLTQLKNGLTLVHLPAVNSPVAHCCLLINCGSRDEKEDKNGLAHFFEHMLFKRTARRNAIQILSELEVAGGEINAYTTKEYTCLHASFLRENTTMAVDLLLDLAFHATFPEDEMTKEKGVICDEIASYEDSPEESIQDDFEEIIFSGSALAHPILGTQTSVGRITRQDLLDFKKQNYTPTQMIVGISGHLEASTRALLEEGMTNPSLAERKMVNRPRPSPSPHLNKTVKKAINQSHCMMGTVSYANPDKNRIAMLLLTNLLGGPGMSAVLNMELREKNGLCYTIDASYAPYSDTGIFSIYFGTDASKSARCVRLIQKQLAKLAESKLGTQALHDAKQRFKGQIALAEENRISVLISICKSIADFGKAESIQEIFNQIDAVSDNQLLEIANEHFARQPLSSLHYDPI